MFQPPQANQSNPALHRRAQQHFCEILQESPWKDQPSTSIHVSLKLIGEGHRVRVYQMESASTQFKDRVLRIPIDSEQDSAEINQTEVLIRHFRGLLPSPLEVDVQIDGSRRRLVTAERISTLQNGQPIKVGLFRTVLDASEDLPTAMRFLIQIKTLIDGCKELYDQYRRLPDFVGHGNIVIKDDRIYILDFNNIIYDSQPAGKTPIIVPLDDKGYPIFDLSLRLLYHIEKTLLSVRYDESKALAVTKKRAARSASGRPKWTDPAFRNCVRSTNKFENLLQATKRGSHEPSRIATFLHSTLRPLSEIKRDKFYAALRLEARREEVQAALDRATRHTRPPI